MSDPAIRFTVRLPAADTAALARLAKDNERTMSYLVRVAVRRYLVEMMGALYDADAQR